MKDRVRRLLSFPDETLKAVISGQSLCNKIWVLPSVPWGAISSYGKTKVQASKPNPQVSAFQGFDQVMSLRQSKDKPKVKGLQVERKEEIFLKNNPIYPK